MAEEKKEDCVAEAMNRDFIYFSTLSEAKNAVKEYQCVPVINNGNLICIAYRGGYTVDFPINIPVVIQAGGLGTRLYPYTKILPKPLIPIGEKPILEHIIDKLNMVGCTEFFVIVNHKKAMIKSYFSEIEKDYTISFIDEDVPLGTGGGLSLLKDRVKGTFILTNCDVLLDIDYSKLLSYHRKNKNVITMACANKKIVIPYGVITADSTGKIIDISEKPEFTFLTNTGLYVVEQEVVDNMKGGENIGFPTVFDNYRNKGSNVSVYEIEETQWMDMGQLDELEKMKVHLEINE